MQRWYVFRGRFLLLMIALVVGGCAGSASGQNMVHMGATSFEQASIRIKKGATIILVDDTSAVHSIENGRWDANGMERPGREPGAPMVDVQIGGNTSTTIGPFNASGTFLLYCTVHPGMNLTVMVT